MSVKKLAAILAVVSIGCGTGDDGNGGTTPSQSGPVTFTGTVAGRTLEVKEALGVRVIAKDSSLDLMVLGIENRTGLCELMRSTYEWSSMGFSMTFERKPRAGTKMAITFPPGTYAVGTTTAAADSDITLKASFYDTDRTCTNQVPTASRSATGGSVTIDSVDLGYVNGSFDVTFGSDRVTGKFKISLCPILFEDVAKKRTCEPPT